MVWLTPDRGEHPAVRLRQRLERSDVLVVPGVFNGVSALLAQRAGAEAVYLSGAAFSASMGIPDIGLVTLDELARAARQIVRVTRLPTIVDADTGFGSAVMVMRTVRELEGARGAGIQIEDQVDPKRCGHLAGKEVTSSAAMAEKVAAAREAAQHLVVVARTDARATHDLDEAIRRGRLYVEAGADVIFPEALETEDEFAEYARAVNVPLLANMTEFGRTPFMTSSEFEALGYKMVIWPVSALRMAAKAQAELYDGIRKDGGTHRLIDRMQTRAELYATIGYHEYEALDSSIITSITPEGMPQRLAD
jgi:methylisocitrate lyase